MSFWIKKYNIKLESLPRDVLNKSIIVVFLCIAILSSILLLLPIQDTIKGDVVIHTKGQPMSVLAPSQGVLHLLKDERELIHKGDLVATIDVDIKQSSLAELKKLIYVDLADLDLGIAKNLIDKINDVVSQDFREVNDELFALMELLQQLDILKSASDPTSLIKTLDKAIQLKELQVKSYKELEGTQQGVLGLIKEQLISDSILLDAGGISQREFMDRRRSYIDKQSVLIENDLRQHEMAGNIIEDEKEKYALLRDHNFKVEELRLSIIDQVSIIRQKYQDYIYQYIIFSPINGYVSIPFDIADHETINKGETFLLLSQSESSISATSEMYVIAQNAGKINKGMKVRIGLSEFDQKEYGIYYTTVKEVSYVQQNERYKISLDCKMPLSTSYEINLPIRNTYNGKGEILIGKINLLTKISREIKFNKTKYASL